MGLILDGIHLKQCVTLYLFSLPFTMVSELGWGTVPIVTLVSFTFMGIEGIAEQIEMPFGKHVCPHYLAVTLTGPSQALMKVISRWVGLHIRSGNFLLTRRTVHRSLLLGFERRDKVSDNLFSVRAPNNL